MRRRIGKGSMMNGLAIRRVFILLLSFLVLSSAFANFCLAAPLSRPGAGQAPHLKDQGHSPHEQSSHSDEVPCYKMQLCCPWIAQNAAIYFFVLGTTNATVFEIAFQLLDIIRPLYHPPEALL